MTSAACGLPVQHQANRPNAELRNFCACSSWHAGGIPSFQCQASAEEKALLLASSGCMYFQLPAEVCREQSLAEGSDCSLCMPAGK